MRVLAASSAAQLPADAVLEVGARLRAQGFLPGVKGIALVFATTHLARDPGALSQSLVDLLGDIPFVGYVGSSAFHDARLRERRPGLVVLVVEGVVGEARQSVLGAPASSVAAELLADGPRGDLRFLSVAADPGTQGGVLGFLPHLDEEPVPVAGALCMPPAGQRPSVLCAPPYGRPGAAILDVTGVRALLGVAHAARPLGPARVVTAAHANVIQELDGRPAFEALLTDLPPALRSQTPRLGGALCAGFGTVDGDALLMRNVVGLDPTTGSIAVAGEPKVGTEIVFSLKDQRAARADLEELLDSFEEGLGNLRPLAVVVFDSMQRDEALFGAPNHDVQQLLARFGTEVPVVGVAATGELCTYGATTSLFGMSCVVCALLPR